MSVAITELKLADVNTVSIPTDAILMLSLLIVFFLLGYLFLNILDNQTNQFVKKVSDNSNLELVKEKLEDQLILESNTVNHEKLKKPKIKKFTFLPLSKPLGIGSLAIVAIGASSLLGIQNIQNSYKRVNSNQVKINTENESAKSLLSNQSQTTIKKISYVHPFLSTSNSYKNNNFNQVKVRKTVDFFSF